MTEPVNPGPSGAPSPEPGGEEPAARDIGATISAIAEDISERVTVLVDKATPVVRDAAARASELVAKAGEAAGPAAHRAAEATEQLGVKVAAKGRDIAADLRRSATTTDAAPEVPAAAADAVPAAPPAAAVDPVDPPPTDHPAG
jgi:hypothetical protein